MLQGKKVLRMQMSFGQPVCRLEFKIRDEYPELCGCAQNHCKEQRRVRVRVRWHVRRNSHHLLALTGEWGHGPRTGRLLEAHKGKERDALLEPPLGTELCWPFALSQVSPSPTSDPQIWGMMHFCRLKPPGLRHFVRASGGS